VFLADVKAVGAGRRLLADARLHGCCGGPAVALWMDSDAVRQNHAYSPAMDDTLATFAARVRPRAATSLLRPGRRRAPLRLVTQRQFGEDGDGHRLVTQDPFAFLLGVLFDHGMPAERAWQAPRRLQQRLGHLDPRRMATEPEAVAMAIAEPPVLHRYRHTMASWVVAAAVHVVDEYGGQAERLWSDGPTCQEAHGRFTAFAGIGNVKARRALDILVSDFGVHLREEVAAS
jgi:uncharacterized HhH-GPD family protein